MLTSVASEANGVPVPRIQWQSYSKQRFHDEFVVKNLPCIIEGVIDDWPALSKWQDPAYLLEKIGPDSKFMVEFVNKKYCSYLFDENRRFADARIITTFRQFVEHCLSHTEPTDGDLWYCSQQYYPILHADYSTPDVMLEPKLLTTPYAWIAQIGAGPGLHIDMVDNVLCHIRGEKKVLLIPPEDTKYCYPRLDGQSNFSDIADVNDKETIAAKFPLFQHARRSEVVLKPGDALFLPANWWHETWALTPFCIGINFFFTTAGGADFGITLDEYDLLEQLVREKFKKMAPFVRDHFVRYFDHSRNAMASNNNVCSGSNASPCAKTQ